MTYEQFWYGDATMTRDYYKAYKINEEHESEKTEWIIWEQGLYIYEALCDVAPIVRPFSKSTKPLHYPHRPWALKSDIEKQKQEEIQEKQKQLELYKAQIFFKNWVNANQKRFNEK